MLAIVYISSAALRFSGDDLATLVAQCREKNSRLGVTGILLHKDGDFMQLIEGPDESVRDLAKTIYCDPRHRSIIQLLEREISAREFPDCSLEFQEVSPSKLLNLAKFPDDGESPTAAGRSPILRLLSTFGWRPSTEL